MLHLTYVPHQDHTLKEPITKTYAIEIDLEEVSCSKWSYYDDQSDKSNQVSNFFLFYTTSYSIDHFKASAPIESIV